MKDDPIPEWWPDEVRTKAQAHVEAYVAAARRIRRNRRRLTPAGAETIIREEARTRGISLSERNVQETARIQLTPPWWPWLHPWKAREQGWRFVWEKDEP